MACDGYREQVSAWLDGELSELEEHALQAHLASCDGCAAYAGRCEVLHRSMRVTALDDVPDLVPAIMAAAPPPPARTGVELMRYALGALAATQLVLAVPELFALSSSEPVHVARHLGGWDLAFAVGLLVVAIQPWRARGLLPMVLALGGVMVVTALLDVIGNETAGLGEASHVFELAGLVLVWLLARADRRGTGLGGGSSRRPEISRSGPSRFRAPLHVVRPFSATFSARRPAGVSEATRRRRAA